MRRASVLVGLLVLLVDQLTKLWALRSLSGGRTVDLLGDLLSLRLVANPGAAFSIGTGRTWLVTAVAILICGFVVREILRGMDTRAWALTLGALLGGALGNLVDRILRAPGVGRGHVVDFIDYAGFFVGNVADIAIVGAAIALAWLSLREIPIRSTTSRSPEAIS